MTNIIIFPSEQQYFLVVNILSVFIESMKTIPISQIEKKIAKGLV